MKILITGASSGIGYEISKELIKEKHKLVLHYNKNKKKLKPLLTKNTHTVSQDLSSSLGAQQLYEQTIAHFGFPDVLINNAGIAISSSVNTDADFWNSSWNKTLNVNLGAPAYLCKCFINIKRNKNIHSRFRIINISSRAAFRGETEDFISYACSKGGVVSLTKTIARSFGKKDNVLAFTIAPGFVKTEMIKDFLNKEGENYIKKGIVLDRLTEPKDISPVVSLIVSGKLDHATGSTIDINGGSYLR
ncbi:MAG TPA: SDR family oxidoreductase [Flavobacteriaceae bacterium]|jgi:NAD(P)-dependent dehydrogenase (short-subunit alcohol dehydrogenase family)|nr:SDR family oxidoreductase [Flavobacteriaceae bacterium]